MLLRTRVLSARRLITELWRHQVRFLIQSNLMMSLIGNGSIDTQVTNSQQRIFAPDHNAKIRLELSINFFEKNTNWFSRKKTDQIEKIFKRSCSGGLLTATWAGDGLGWGFRSRLYCPTFFLRTLYSRRSLKSHTLRHWNRYHNIRHWLPVSHDLNNVQFYEVTV